MNAPQKTAADRSFEQGFRLESLEVDPLAGEVSGPGGREAVDRKVMDVFLLMARNPQRVISRDELLARLWPDVVVTDDAVTRCICVLRRHLSRAGGDRRYRDLIETLPKRGYRFSGEIVPLELQSVVASRKTGDRRSMAIVVAISVAVALFLIVGMSAV